MKSSVLDPITSRPAQTFRPVRRLLPKCVGPYERFSASAGMSSAAGYITAPLIGLGLTELSCSHPGSTMLDRIIAFDRAESSAANLTQTNLIAVSSFCGINGLIWGYDLARQPLVHHELLCPNGHSNAFELTPLLKATESLLGTVQMPRFPVAPGEHLVCAYKSHTSLGPGWLYGAMAIGIAEERGKHADLFMEDHGTLAEKAEEQVVLENLFRSVHVIGANLGVRYEKVFLGLSSVWVPDGQVGCALTAAPYLHLAQAAVPSGDPQLLAEMSLQEWESSVGYAWG